MPAVSNVTQASASMIAGQSFESLNIFRMEPNLEKTPPEQLSPIIPMAVPLATEQQWQDSQKYIPKNCYSLEEQQARQLQSSDHTDQRIIVFALPKAPTQPSQYPKRTLSSAMTFEPPSTHSSSASLHMNNEGLSVNYSEHSVSNLAQSVTRRQHVPGLPRIAHETEVLTSRLKLVPLHGKHESIRPQSHSANNQQVPMPCSRLPDTSLLQQQLLEPNKVHNVELQQQLRGKKKKKKIADTNTRKVGARRTALNKQQKQLIVKEHPVPLKLRGHSSGDQRVPWGFSSSQGVPSYVKMISQLQPHVHTVGNKPNSCITLESQNIPRSASRTIESRSVPSETFKTSEVASGGEKRDVPEAWREECYQSIISLKSRYMTRLEETQESVGALVKQLNLQPGYQNTMQLEMMKEKHTMLERMLRVLCMPKEKLTPLHLGSLDEWEKLMVSLMDEFAASKNAYTPLKQGSSSLHDMHSLPRSLPPQAQSFQVPPEEETENKKRKKLVRQPPEIVPKQSLLPLQQPALLQAHIPYQLAQPTGLKEKHPPDQHGDIKCKFPVLPQLSYHASNRDHPDGSLHDAENSHRTNSNVQSEAQRSAALVSKASDMADTNDCEIVQAKAREISQSLAVTHNHNENIGNYSKTISNKTSVNQSPIQRLINAVRSISPQALRSSVDDMHSVMSMMDGMEASAASRTIGSKGVVGEDLGRTTQCRLQARNCLHDGETRRHLSSVPMESRNDQDGESTNETYTELPRNGDTSRKLLEEIKDINMRLIDNVVNACEEDDSFPVDSTGTSGVGTLVNCCFSGVSVNSSLLKSLLESSDHLSVFQPLRLLVPTDYPNRSPVLLNKLPEIGDDYTDLSNKAMSRFGRSLRCLEDPILLSDMARTWESCVRKVIIEHAERLGGGTFSSINEKWENC